MNFWDLPSGWKWKPISNLADDTGRRNPKEAPAQDFRYVDIGSVDKEFGRINLLDVKTVEGRNAPSRARKIIHKDDVVFATTRPYLRNIALVPESLNDQICSTGLCVLRAKKGLTDSRYLYFACRSDFFINQLIPKQRGANYPAVTDSDVYETQLPVPYSDEPERSLAEQRRIVARIEALLAEVREMRKLHDEITADADNLLNAFLRETFDELQQNYLSKNLGDTRLCEVIPGQHILARDYKDSPPGTPYITGPADFGEKYPFISRWTTKPKVLSQSGDLLFTVKGSGVGKVNCVPVDMACAIGRQIMAIRPNPTILITDYLFYNLRGRFHEFQQLRQGAAIPGIRKEHVELIELPIPPIEIQKQVVSRLETIRTEAEEMQRSKKHDLLLLVELEQAILAQAFQGEL